MARVRLPAILVLAALVRLALLAAMWPDDARLLRQDTTASYLPLVQSLEERGAFSPAPGAAAETVRTPGYPAFLVAVRWLLGRSHWAVALAQVALSLVIVWLAWRLGRAAGGEGAGEAAALILAVDPVSVIHSVTLLSETLFTALFAGAVLCAWRCGLALTARGALLGALALGLAVLVRPIALYVIPLYGLWIALAGSARAPHRLGIAGLALALALAPPLAWMARNQALGAGFMLSSIEGLNALYYRAAPALARAKGISWDDANRELETELAKRTAAGMPQAQAMRVARDLAVEVLRAHPREAALVALEGAVRMWAGPGAGDLMVMLDVAELGSQARWPTKGSAARRGIATLLAVIAWLVHGAITFGAAAGTVVALQERRWRLVLFAVPLLAAFTVLSASPGAYARLRVPVMPVVAMLAAVLVARSASAPTDRPRPLPGAEPAADPLPAPPGSAS
jgi:4-amino-4-deoxy-L-arabinose transferase-like glycosyltransferase